MHWQLHLALPLPAEPSPFWWELCTLQPGSLSLAVASCCQSAVCVLAPRTLRVPSRCACPGRAAAGAFPWLSEGLRWF